MTLRPPIGRTHRPRTLDRLENRLLFDGASLAIDLYIEPLEKLNPISDCDQCVESPYSTDRRSEFDQPAYGENEMVFIDAGVDDHENILAGLKDQGVEAFLIESDSDGLEQIAKLVGGRAGLDGIHLVSHGSSGELRLGNASIQESQLNSQYSDVLASIGDALALDGDIFIYGCDLASDEAGRDFVQTLSHLTGAEVAASDDITGSSQAGGDWDLEFATGTVQASGVVTSSLRSLVSGTLPVEIQTGTDSSGSTEVFLRGNFVEVGLRDQGTFGSETAPPAGWHARNNNTTTYLGFVANPQNDNWATQDGDFFAPGTPVESFMIEINGSTGASLINNTSGDVEQNPGSLSTPTTTELCDQDAVSVSWSGTSHGVLDVERTYSVLENGLFIAMQTTMTNTSASTLTDVYFAHNVDPDNDVSIGAGYATTNTIVSQPGATNVAHVSATQTANDGSYISLVAEDARARVTHGGFNNVDASDIWNGVGLNSAVGTVTSADQAISLAFKFDTIAPGETVSFDYIYILADGAAIVDAFECLHAPTLDLDVDGSAGAAGADYKANYAVGAAGIPIADTDAKVTDTDSTLLQQATINLTNAFAGDSLTALTGDASWPAGISIGSSTATSITLTGNATLAEYETALGLIEFGNSSATPDMTERIIEIQVQDIDNHNSNLAITTVCFANAHITKEQVGSPVRNSTDPTQWDVEYQLTVENTGNLTLSGIDVTEDLASAANFGAAFVSTTSLTASDLVFTGTGAAPTINGSWNGSTVTNMLSDDGTLNVGDSFTLNFTVTLDLAAGGVDPTALTNQATLAADAPNNPANESFITDDSDSGSDPTTNNDAAPGATAGNEDDPTPLIIQDIEVSKQVTLTNHAASGTAGNFDVTYNYVLENTGTEPLTSLSLIDELQTQFGGALVGVLSVGVTNVSATSAPTPNGSFSGLLGNADLLTGSIADDLQPGESFQVTLVVEIDPDNATANYNAGGALENQAIASGRDGSATISDLSDDPSVLTDIDLETDGEGDDPTTLSLAALAITKEAATPVLASTVVGSTGTTGNYVIDYTLTIRNLGNDLIDNLSLIEDLDAQFGGAFVQVIGSPTINVTNTSGTSTVNTNSTAYDGDTTTEVLNTATSQLGVTDSVQIVIQVEVDPDSATAVLVNGTLQNSAVASGTDSTSAVVSDVSDDPNDLAESDPDGDGNPDDPTNVGITDLVLTKAISSTAPAASSTLGNYDVTYTLTVSNAGTEAISNLSLVDNLAAQFGSAFIGVHSTTVIDVDATSVPAVNPAFDGTAGSDMLTGAPTNDLRPGESFTVVVVVEVDPDAIGAVVSPSGALENQAAATGDGENGGLAQAVSDDPADLTESDDDSDGHPDDATAFLIADLAVEKQFIDSVNASSGTPGNFDITYDMTITNTGNDPISNLSLVEDLFGQFGGAFQQIVLQGGQVASIQASTAANDPEFNAAFNGNALGAGDSELIDNGGANTNLLQAGESITIRLIAEVDPDAIGAILVSGALENQATVTGTGTTGVITELSDDPDDPTDNDAAGDADPDDVTRVLMSSSNLDKSIFGAPVKQADGTWNVTYRLTYTNTGGTLLSNLILLDDVAAPGNLGGTWLSTTAVAINTLGVVTGTPPTLNAAWQANPSVNMLTGGSLGAGESIEITFTVNVDPDHSGTAATPLLNQATVSAEDPGGNAVIDISDDPSDLSDIDLNGDANPDDPTAVSISDIGVAKQINSVIETSGLTGSFDVEYAIVIENTGTVDLTNIQATEQLGGIGGHFGAGFSGVVTAPSVVAANIAGVGSVPTIDPTWNGTTNVDLFDGVSGLLEPGDSIVLTFTVQVDTLVGGVTFDNQVEGSADGAGTPATDLSDDGTNPNTNNGDASEDTPTPLEIPQIRSSKIHGVVAQNPDGTYTVPVTIGVTNTGTVNLTNLQIQEDIGSQFADGFISVQNPTVSSVLPFLGILPTFNAAWLGDTSLDVFTSAASLVLPGEAFEFTFEVIVDPDAVDNVAEAMENQATVFGDGINFDGSTITVDDESGNNSSTTSGVDNDEPSPLIIPEVSLEKELLSISDASSGTADNIDATYEFTLTNSGTSDLQVPIIRDDWATQFGTAFVRIVDADLSDDVTAPLSSGINGNSSYAGGPADSLVDASGVLKPGESFSVRVTVEIDLDGDIGRMVNGAYENQATAQAEYDPNPAVPDDEVIFSDLSDDPNDGANVDANGDGDPDDPTALSLARATLLKEISNIDAADSGIAGNYEVQYQFTVTNSGTETLSNLSLTDDLATQLGGAFVNVISLGVINNDATTAPTVNLAYDGTGASDMLLGSPTDEVRPGQSFRVVLTVEVDPDNATGVFNPAGQIENLANVIGDGENGGTAIDRSDDPNFAGPGDDEENPTALSIGALELTKAASTPVNAASGVTGNFDVTYTFVLTNTGNETLTSLTIFDDWATELGGAFVGVVDTDLSNNTSGSVLANGNPSYNGGAADNLFAAGSSLAAGESVTVVVTVEVDPDHATAALVNGALENRATASATGSSGPVSDLSDDPSNPTNIDTNGNNTPDDTTSVAFAGLNIAKTITSIDNATSNADGNYDVTYSFVVTNTGTEAIDNLSLVDDLVSQMGGAFVQVVSVAVANVDATSAPLPNPAYNGTSGSDMLLGSATDDLATGQSFVVTLVIEIDPDHPTANYGVGGLIQNSATVTGQGENGGTPSDLSDDTANATNADPDGDNNPDDATSLSIGDLDVQKLVASTSPANQFAGSTSTFGNHVVEYTIVIENRGNELITNLSLLEDLESHFGGGFVQVIGTPTISVTNSSGNATVNPNAALFDGETNTEFFDPATSQLDMGDSVSVTFFVEVDPDNPSAVLVSGAFSNRAVVSGTDTSSNPVSDLSDDPSDLNNVDPDGDNNPDDPTLVSFADLAVTKSAGGAIVATSGTSGNYDVTFTFNVTNNGSEAISNLSLVDDLATQFGGAFVRVVSVDVTNVDATSAPAANPLYDGTGGSDMLLGGPADDLQIGQSFTVVLVIELDPDNAAAVYDANGTLANVATGRGAGENGGTATSDSDNPSDPTDNDDDGDGSPDDATTFVIGDMTVTKSATVPVRPAPAEPGSTGTVGNLVVDYVINVSNTGNDTITMLSLLEDLETQLGGAFVQLIGSPQIFVSNVSGTAAVNSNGTTFDGDTTIELFDVATSQLGLGDSVTVILTVELDPDSPTAVLNSGVLENSAVASGLDTNGATISDASDDPNNLTDADPDGDNNPDDPTGITFALLSLTKETTSVDTAASGTVGNFDVTYTFTMTNSGTETLSDLSLIDDLAGQLGGAFVQVVNVAVTNIDATNAPIPNAGYDGTNGSDMLIGSASDSLQTAQSFTVTLVVELDPDNATALFDAAGQLLNTANASGQGDQGSPAAAISDDPNNPTNGDSNGDGQPDDPTGLLIGSLEVLKTAGVAATAASIVGSTGNAGNFVIPYTITINNLGNDLIDNFRLIEDLATQFGGAFVQIVGTPSIVLTNSSGTSVTAPNPTAFDGDTSIDVFDTATSQLGVEDSVTVTILVEVDPDNATAILTNGFLQNSAIGQGTDTNGDIISDSSDDPANPSTAPDDTTGFSVADIALTKSVATVLPAASGTVGNYDVTFQFILTNTGSESLSNLSLSDDLSGQFGGAFQGVVSVAITNVDAANAPTANPSYDGTAASDLLLGASTDDLRPGQSFTVTLVVEIDPDNAAGIYNSAGQLENSAITEGVGENGGTATSSSDNPADPSNQDDDGDGQPDDPTTFAIGDLEVFKTAGAATPANGFGGSSGAAGNFVVPYTVTINNTGNDLLTNLTLIEDLLAQFGGGFVQLIGTPSIALTNTSGTSVVNPNATMFDGSTTTEVFDSASSQLGIGDSVTVTINVELDPDHPTALLVNGALQNSATAGGTDSNSNPVSDDSDDPTDPSTDPDDETGFSIADLALTKAAGAALPATSGTVGSYDVTLILTVTNTGSETLSNLSLLDDLATQFGGAFIQVVSVGVSNVDSTMVPAANSAYNGTAASDMLLGSATDQVEPGQSFQVILVVEVDPDNVTGTFNASGQLENTATAAGDGENGGAALGSSDNPADLTNDDDDGDGQPDDPTTFAIGDLEVFKTAGIATPANGTVGSSGTAGNFVVPYTITIHNRGNDLITNLSVLEDLVTQFGGGFVQLLGTPTIVLTNNSGNSVANPNTTPFDGDTTIELLDTATGRLGIGDSLTIDLAVEIDPDNAAANLIGGSLQNMATASGTGSNGQPVSDDSDDPTDPSGADDPTGFSLAQLSLTKSTGSVIPASSGTSGNFDVTFTLTMSNTGTESLSHLSLVDNLAAQMGGAFVQIVSVAVTNVDATAAPLANGGYNGAAGSDMLLGSASDELRPGESFVVTIVAELDPDSSTAVYDANGFLANSASGAADGENGGTAATTSDSPSDLTDDDDDGDGQPDDPTTFAIGDIQLLKSISNAVAAASGTIGNLDVTYEFTLMNTGNTTLSNLAITDNWIGNLGGAFIGIVDGDLSDGDVIAPSGSGANGIATYLGGVNQNMLDGFGSLAAGESLTVTVTVEIDPDNSTAIFGATGGLENQALGSADDTNGSLTDTSDNPLNGADSDTDGDNDPDDTTTLFLKNLTVAKDDGGTVAIPGGSVVWTINFGNSGATDAAGVVLTEILPAGTSFDAAASTVGWVETSSGSGVFQFALGLLTAGNSGSILFGVTVDDAIPNGMTQLENIVSISDDGSTGPESTLDDNSDSDTTPLSAAPDYQIEKTDGSVSTAPGESVTYTITVTNVGSQDGIGITVSDLFPTTILHNVSADNGGLVDMAAGTVTWSIATLAAGDSIALTVTGDIAETIASGVDDFTNQATVEDDGSNGADPDPTNNIAEDTNALAAAPDYSVTKSDGVASVTSSDTLTYTISVSNVGNQGGTNVVVTDLFPTSILTVTSATGGGTIDAVAGTVTWTIGSLPAGDTIDLSVEATVASQFAAGVDSFQNTVSLTDDGANGIDPDPSNNSATDTNNVLAFPDFQIDKQDAITSASTGDAVEYTITVENVGDQTGTTIVVEDFFPTDVLTNVTATDGGVIDMVNGTITWNLASLAAGASHTFTVNADVVAALPPGIASFTNAAIVSDDGSNGDDPTPGDNVDEDTNVFDGSVAPDYEVSKSDGLSAVTAGQPVTYTIVVRNGGDQGGTNIVVTDQFDTALLENLVPSNGGIIDPVAGTITWTIPVLNAGQELTFTVSGNVVPVIPSSTDVPSAAFVRNTVEVTDDGSNGIDPTPGNNFGEDNNFLNSAPDYAIDKNDSLSVASPGDTITYSIAVSNIGSRNGTNIVVTDTFPSDILTNLSADNGGIIDFVAGTIVWNIPELDAGEIRALTVTAEVVSPAPAGIDEFTNSATITDDGTNGDDPNPLDNQSTDTNLLDASPGYSIRKDDGLTTATAGNTINYTISFEHLGLQNGTGVTIVDTYPADILHHVTASDSGIVDVDAGTITWNLGSTSVGDQYDFTVTAVVRTDIAAGIDSFTNSVTVADDGTNGPDPNPANNSDSDTDVLDAAPDYEITKSDGADTLSPGDATAYTITVTNVGTQAGTNIVVTDTYPTALLHSMSTDNGGIVDSANGTITWNVSQLAVGESLVLTVSGEVVGVAPARAEQISNAVSVTDDGANGDDPDLDNSTDTDTNELAASPDLNILKTVDNEEPTVGDTLTYTLTVTNTGTQHASGVVIREMLLTGTSFDSATSSQGWLDLGSGNYVYSVGDVAVGQTVVVEFAVTVEQEAAGTELVNTATVEDDGLSGVDANQPSNASTTSTDVAGGASFASKRYFLSSSSSGIYDSLVPHAVANAATPAPAGIVQSASDSTTAPTNFIHRGRSAASYFRFDEAGPSVPLPVGSENQLSHELRRLLRH